MHLSVGAESPDCAYKVQFICTAVPFLLCFMCVRVGGAISISISAERLSSKYWFCSEHCLSGLVLCISRVTGTFSTTCVKSKGVYG